MASKRDGGLRPLFFRMLPQFHWVAMETGLVTQGVPDANYCGNGAEGWIEFKATKSNAIGLRPAQVGWILRRVRSGGCVWIAVRAMRTLKSEALWMIPGGLAREVKTGGLAALAGRQGVRAFPGGPNSWPWAEIDELLRK